MGSFAFVKVCSHQIPLPARFEAILPPHGWQNSPLSLRPGFSSSHRAIPSIRQSFQPPALWLHSFPFSLSWWPRPSPRDGLSLIIQEISARAAAVSLAPALLRLRGSELLLGAGSTKNISSLSLK